MKRARSIQLLSTLAVALPASAFSVVWNNQVTEQDVLNFGNSAYFQGIGQVNAQVSGGYATGTGTFLGFGNGYAWGLTANHVTAGGSGMTFSFADGRTYDIQQTYFIGQDVTIFRMATFASGVFTPTLNPNGAFSLGEDIEGAGYGLYGPQGTPLVNLGFDNQRRGWQSTISDSGYENFAGININYIRATFNAPGSAGFRPFEGTTEAGDSGSPLITSDGTILGVLTGGSPGNAAASYGAITDFCELSPSMVSQIDVITGVPEPASCAVFGLALIVLVLRNLAKGSPVRIRLKFFAH